MQFVTPLSTAAWFALACVPLAIVGLYFLKLRRRPVQIASTMLWKRSLEDLHVNSLFQRLRRNLLLFLQLLAVGLAMLALAGPRIKGSTSQGQRYILLIDRSASMSATDIAPTRLGKAKAEARKLIENMRADDLVMIIAFADRAEVVSNYSTNRAVLLERLSSIGPSESTTALREALQLASGLANPSSDVYARNLPQGVIASQARIPPKLMIYTDGGFEDVGNFSIGNLEPEVVVIGPPPPPYQEPAATEKAEPADRTRTRGNPSDNVAILALQASRNEEKPDQFQVFGRIRNSRGQPTQLKVRLLRHDLQKAPSSEPALIDTLELSVPAQDERSFKFDMVESGPSALEVRIDPADALALDDRAFLYNGPPRRAQVLLVTAGNRYLVDTLNTPATAELAELTQAAPEEIKTDPLARDIRSGRFDLVVFDNVRPEVAPEANALYFGTLPPGPAYANPRNVEAPVVLDWDVAHPLLQYVRDLNLIRVAKAQVVDLPTGATSLIESSQGSLAFMVPRDDGHVDAVIGFPLLSGKDFNTDWPVRSYSFPLFLFNALRVLGNARDASSGELHRPGQPVAIRVAATADRVTVTSPSGEKQELKRTAQGEFVDNDTAHNGLYRVTTPGEPEPTGFAVNLLDARESDLATRGIVPEGAPSALAESYLIKIGYTPLKGTRAAMPIIREWWKALAVVVLGVVLLEWYVYNRRVYV